MADSQKDTTRNFNNGTLRFREGKFEQEAVIYSRALKEKSDWGKYDRLADLLYSQRKYKQAMRKYKKTVQINELWTDGLDKIGLCLINLGEFEQAIEFFQKTIDFEIDFVDAYIHWALALLLQGKEREMLKVFEKVKRRRFNAFTKNRILKDLETEVKSANEVKMKSTNQDEIKLAQERVEGLRLMREMIKDL